MTRFRRDQSAGPICEQNGDKSKEARQNGASLVITNQISYNRLTDKIGNVYNRNKYDKMINMYISKIIEQEVTPVVEIDYDYKDGSQ